MLHIIVLVKQSERSSTFVTNAYMQYVPQVPKSHFFHVWHAGYEKRRLREIAILIGTNL